MASKLEQDLLADLQAEQARNARATHATPPEVLPLEMMLPASSYQDIRAAQKQGLLPQVRQPSISSPPQWQAPPPVSTPAPKLSAEQLRRLASQLAERLNTSEGKASMASAGALTKQQTAERQAAYDQSRRSSPIPVRSVREEPVFASEDFDVHLEEPEFEANPQHMQALHSIFMGRDGEEAAQYAASIHGASSDDSFFGGFAYDSDDTIGGRASPNEAVRFQVGREDPPSRPINIHAMVGDGAVVSRRGANGRWEAQARQTVSRSEAVSRTAVEALQNLRQQATASTPSPYERPNRPSVLVREPEVYRPSVYERLITESD